jgi:hypothetical protein
MPRATCRCGHAFTFPDGEVPERLVCLKCGAKVRVRLKVPTADGFLRFGCPCGRRLKVSADRSPTHGKCPDCGRVVPVPQPVPGRKPPGHPESPTDELGTEDRATLDAWARRHQVRASNHNPEPTPPAFAPKVTVTGSGEAGPVRAEAGLRICPNCKKPVHLGADVCRVCNTPVPRK